MSRSLGNKPKQIFSKIRGYNRWMKTMISINEYDNSEVAKYRLKVINHYQQYGLSSTLNAYPVDRSNILWWQQKLKRSAGKLSSFVPGSTKPHNKKTTLTDPAIVEQIARLRKKHWRLGKNNPKPLVDQFCEDQVLLSAYLDELDDTNRFNHRL